MKRMAGIIFSNIYDTEFGELASDRAVASMPFAGRYRFIDFVLSGMVNSNITSVGVITKYNYESLMNHLGTCEEWDLNRKNGGLTIIPPFAFGSNGVYHGKLEALYNALKYLKQLNEEYVIMAETVNVCNIDFEKVLKNHVDSGKDITAIACSLDKSEDNNKAVYNLDENGELVSISVNCSAQEGSIVGIGMYVMKRELLISAVERSVADGFYHFEKDLVQKCFNTGELSVNVYSFNGVVLRNKNLCSYLENNLKLTDEKIREGLFLPTSSVYTKVRDEIPTYYGDKCRVVDCVIADGCIIDGTVERSAIFRNVKIAEGARVIGSVLMQGTTVSKDAYLENVIIDMDVTVTAGQRLIGSKTAPVIIKKGETV